MNFITSDGVKLSYELKGQYGQPVIVFVNGYSASQCTWLEQVPAFMAQSYRVLTWDYRSHGHSQRVDYGLRIARLAQDLAELLTSLQLDRLILIGHSMGVSVSYALLSLHPEISVMALITEDQPPKMIADDDWHYGRHQLTYADIVTAAKKFPTMRLIKRPLPQDVKIAIGQQTVPFDYGATLTLLIDGLGQNFLDVVRHEQMPHLFLAGGASLLYDAEHAAAAHALQQHPLSQDYVFADCGHIPHLEAADEFNRVVTDWLTTLKL